jgi:hypothetical protein
VSREPGCSRRLAMSQSLRSRVCWVIANPTSGDSHFGRSRCRDAVACEREAAAVRTTGSAALRADAAQSALCAYLSLIALTGLAINAIWQ